jgi:hypothetical protein
LWPSSAKTPTSDFCAAGSLLLPPGNAFPDPDQGDYDPPNIQPPKPIDGYICRAEGSVKRPSTMASVTQAAIFDLNDVLDRDAPTTERAEEYTSSWPTCEPGPLQMPLDTNLPH